MNSGTTEEPWLNQARVLLARFLSRSPRFDSVGGGEAPGVSGLVPGQAGVSDDVGSPMIWSPSRSMSSCDSRYQTNLSLVENTR